MGVITPKMIFDFFRVEDRDAQLKTKLAEYYGRQPCTKSIVWRNENEWRMLWQNDETRLKIHRVPIPSDAITAVYVGLVDSKNVEDDIAFETQRKFPEAKVFRAYKKHGFSELKFSLVGLR